MAPKTFIGPNDFEYLPRELWLQRFNHDSSLDEAIQLVNTYLPVPEFSDSNFETVSTTVIAAFYPPPKDEAYQRCYRNGKPKLRSPDDYINGPKDMIFASSYLIIFVPPGEIADELRTLSAGKNVVFLDHYKSVWDLPHLRAKRESFYTTQIELHQALGPRGTQTGEPHSWGAWNAKTFLWLEAIKLDPFKTSHFVWLDARTPFVARTAFPDDVSLVAGTWPHPEAVASMYREMKTNSRTVVVLSYDHALSPPVKNFWPTKRSSGKTTNDGIDDVIGIGVSLFLGDKASMSRFARAHLILFERDFARDFYVAREELQMSYAFWEFNGLCRALEPFRRRPLPTPMKMDFFAYMLLSKPDTNWSGLGLGKNPERLLDGAGKFRYQLETFLRSRWVFFKQKDWKAVLSNAKPKAPDAALIK